MISVAEIVFIYYFKNKCTSYYKLLQLPEEEKPENDKLTKNGFRYNDPASQLIFQ